MNKAFVLGRRAGKTRLTWEMHMEKKMDELPNLKEWTDKAFNIASKTPGQIVLDKMMQEHFRAFAIEILEVAIANLVCNCNDKHNCLSGCLEHQQRIITLKTKLEKL